uniref:Outer-membrane lipoprotein LolB n=1 Tax=Magnetococcus massalia (strain MO-1) TaxID=451514 RepID=A0A1S7LLU2_MAGMO|nr:conserved protein of unknown function [Candidatus Magnetococcus massalia]
MLLIGGCAPKQPAQFMQEGVRWHAYEAARGQQIALQKQVRDGWRVDGSLRLESAHDARSVRVRVDGQGQTRMRLQAMGPFRQLMMEVWLGPLWLERLLPEKKQVERVSADAAGLGYFTGVALDPKRLVALLLGVAELKDHWVWYAGDYWLTTGQGDKLRLDPATGRLLERRGKVHDDLPYIVRYHWPEKAKPGRAAMPSRIEVSVGEQSSLLLRAKRWKFGVKPPPESWRHAYPDTAFLEFWPLRK